MAQLAIGLAGAAIGGAVAPAGFAILGLGGAQLGFLGGSILGGALFGPDLPAQHGPRLEDLRVQVSTLGKPIPRVHATYQVAGNVIWSSGIVETRVTDEVGGKGGLSGPSQKQHRYLYSASLAIGLCAGPIAGVLKVEGDTKPIADFATDNTGPTLGDAGAVRVYLGSEGQEPDPLIQADVGVDDTPAFRGLAYIVIEELQLADFGNRIPNIAVELFTEGSGAYPLVSTAGVNGVSSSAESFHRAADGLFYTMFGAALSQYDALTQQVLFDGDVGDPDGVSTLGAGGGFVVEQDGSTAFAMGNDGNFAKLNAIHLGSMTVSNAAGPGPTFSYPLPSRYDFPAGGHYLATRKSATRVDVLGVGVAVVPRLIACQQTSSGKIVVVNPDIATYSPFAYRYGIVGEVSAGNSLGIPVELASRTIGRPAFDDNLTLWCASTNATQVFVHCYAFDLGLDAEFYLNPDDEPKYSGESLLAIDGCNVEITADMLDLDGGDATVLATWVQEQNALLLLLGDYAYLFDCASQAIVGTGLQVTQGGANTALETTMQGGVQADGKIVFKWDEDTLTVLDVRAWSVEQAKHDLTDWGALGTTQHGAGYVPELGAWCGLTRPTAHLVFLDRQGDGSKPLDEVVEEELLLSGLTAGEIDVTALSGDSVLGYAVATQSRVRDNIEPLAQVHRFDLVEIDGKLTAVPRGGALGFTIPEADLGAYPAGSARPVSLLESRAAERALPLRIDLAYVSREAQYEPATQHDSRVPEATASRQVATVSTAEVLSDDLAKQAVRALMAQAWEAAVEYETALGQKWLRLDPSDRGTLPAQGGAREVRVVQTDLGADWIVRLRARRDSGSIYTQSAEGTAVAFADAPGLAFVGASVLFLMDLPPLRDEDYVFGLLVGAGPVYAADNYPGALVSDSYDGVDYAPLADISAGSAYGYAVDALAEAERWTVVDRASSVTVRWVNGDEPATVSDSVFIDNGAVYLIGDELVLVRDVADNADGTFTFSHLLRGRLGTENAIAGHAAGDRVVRLDAGTLRFVKTSIERLDVARYFRVETLGQQLPTLTAQVFTNTGRVLQPPSPYHVQVARQSNGDLVITWEYRTPLAELWRTTLQAPLASGTESYSIDFLDGDGDVVRTAAIAGARTYTYTRAMQIADGVGGGIGSPLSALTVLNHSFEDDGADNVKPPADWTAESGTWRTKDNDSATPNPVDGDYWATTSAGVAGVMSQRIDLAAGGVDTADIDNDLVVLALAWVFGLSGSADFGNEALRFLDAGEVEISTASGVYRQPTDDYPSIPGTQEDAYLVAAVPAGARYVDIVFDFDDVGGAGTQRLFADNVRLSYGPPGPAGLTFDLYQVVPVVGRGIARRVAV